MYTIAEVIYGVPLTEKVYNKIEDDFEEYFETSYSGSSKYPVGFVGVSLGSIDECDASNRIDLTNGQIYNSTDATKAKSFSIIPTDEQKAEVQNKIDQLPDEIKELLPPIGIYFLWSTS
jgi:hypothetical protein